MNTLKKASCESCVAFLTKSGVFDNKDAPGHDFAHSGALLFMAGDYEKADAALALAIKAELDVLGF